MVKKNSLHTVRLPLFRAPFYFAPEYLEHSSEWTFNFSTLIYDLLRGSKLPWQILDRYHRCLTVRFSETEFTICPRQGTFMIEEWHDGAEEDFDAWVGPLEFPASFTSKLRDCEVPQRLRDETRTISFFADDLAGSMNRRFDEALSLGVARYEGRFGSIESDFSLVEADQFTLLTLCPMDRDPEGPGKEVVKLDKATTEHGEIVYSLCVVPTMMPSTVFEVAPATSSGSPDGRVLYPPQDYVPVIVECVKQETKQFGKDAKQAGVIHRARDEYERRGMNIPSQKWFEKEVRKYFPKQIT